ncbi:flippase-like domain-containing protein [bacterium]|nr:flippase-like domain-containing protein [bacterium]
MTPCADPAPEARRRSWTGLVPVLVSLLLLGALLTHFTGGDLLARVSAGWLVLALAASFFLNNLVGALKWREVLRLSRIQASYRELFPLWCGLQTASFFMPFQSGHLLYVLAIRKIKNLNLVEAAETIAYDKYLSAVGTCALIAGGQFLLPAGWPWPRLLVGGAAGAFVIAFFFDTRILRLAGRIEWIARRSRLVGHDASVAQKLRLLALAVVYQSSDVVTFYLAFRAMAIPVDTAVAVGAFPLVLLLSYVPITFSGIGAREALIVLLIGRALSFDESVASGIFVDLVEYVWPALAGVVFVRGLLRLLPRRAEGSA